ncbi:MAG TPA: hypothetical protein VFU81_10010, partial [Thermomicrobiales bacterium]|nr:hypothetical protein [Thermomicrobiales bacterium]
MDEANAARYAHDVLLVAAGKWAYACFTDFARSDREGQYTAYICQAGRSFRSDVERLGYYVNGAIRPEFPLIFARRDHVDLTPQTAREFRSSGDLEDARFAAIVEQAMIDPHPGPVEQIFLLS